MPEIKALKMLSPSAGLLVQGRRLRAKAAEPEGDKTFLKISFPPQPTCDGRSAAPELTPRGAGGERNFRVRQVGDRASSFRGKESASDARPKRKNAPPAS